MCPPLTKQRMAGSEIFTTFQITMRFKVKIWNSDLDKLKKYNVRGDEKKNEVGSIHTD